jgi:hypothetical protein
MRSSIFHFRYRRVDLRGALLVAKFRQQAERAAKQQGKQPQRENSEEHDPEKNKVGG